MFQPMYETDALVLKTRGIFDTGFRGVVTASTSVLVQDKDYTITLPIAVSGHKQINIMINNSPTASQDFVSPNYASLQYKRHSDMPITNPNFEANWVNIGVVQPLSLTAVITNVPTRFLRLEGESFTAVNFYAFVWTQKMSSGY